MRVVYSNDLDALGRALVETVFEIRGGHGVGQGGDPLTPLTLIAPNRRMEVWAELRLAQGLGIAANLTFQRLRAFIESEGRAGEPALLSGGVLRARVLGALSDRQLLDAAAMAKVKRYVLAGGEAPEAVDRRRGQLALRLVRLFEAYAATRPELGARWLAEGDEPTADADFQPPLYRWLRRPELPPVESALERFARRASGEAGVLEHAATPLILFGFSYLDRSAVEQLSHLAERRRVHLFAINPCQEFWEDVETPFELKRRRRKSSQEPAWLEAETSVDTETPLLRLWGRPGREFVQLVDLCAPAEVESAFVDPAAEAAEAPRCELPLFQPLSAPTLLARLQRDVLHRAPLPAGPPESGFRDESVQVLACPSVRREVESVAVELFRALGADPSLHLHEVAIFMPEADRERYIPHLTAVLRDAHRIPHTFSDLALAAESEVVDGALRLLSLMQSQLTRTDVLALLTHPALRPHLGDADPTEVEAIVERLGIFHGIDRSAQPYLEGDALNWEQGLLRLALGGWMETDPAAPARFTTFEGRSYLPEPIPPGERGAARLVGLMRSLIGDVRFAQGSRCSLTDWGRFLSALFAAYLVPRTEGEEGALRRAQAEARRLSEWDHEGAEVTFALAAELVRASLGQLRVGRGQALAHGVQVGPLLPMRAVPFRVVFLLGMGEGRFPSRDHKDALDLRADSRRLGDVNASEKDRYACLETLMSTREKLILSYVARDGQTGDALPPGAVLSELMQVIEQGYLKDPWHRLVSRPPLRREADEQLVRVLPAARAERRAAELGDALRETLAEQGRSEVLGRSPPGAVARAVAKSPALMEALGLLPFRTGGFSDPPRARGQAEPRSLSASDLRRFVACPMQAWTRTLLRPDLDAGVLPAHQEECFAPPPLLASSALRFAFAREAAGLEPWEQAYRRRTEALAARGRWPVGALADFFFGAHRDVISQWLSAWSSLSATGLCRVRFGRFAPFDESDVDGPDRPAPLLAATVDRPFSVELTGQSELCTPPDGSALLLLLPTQPPAPRRMHLLRSALRAFLDHALLSAGGAVGPRRVVFCYGDAARVDEIAFPTWSQEAAHGYLSDLATDLLTQSHAYLFPCEAVLRLLVDGQALTGDRLVSSILFVRDRLGGGSSRFGPIRRPLAAPLPDPGRAENLAARRLGPFIAALCTSRQRAEVERPRLGGRP